ncbi:helix-turn-helix domain-containing protein [Paraburkholderia sp. PREW-6R]|uniref:helix-turn-helix domain-containing protein n=1 Tax=Paraburkholderia sp. PREW-6R TaxID=3141544 RepID=UPI0031F577D3
MSTYALAWAKRQVIGNPSAKAVLKVYADWATEDFSTWVSNDELIADTELDVKTIRKARALLIELGYLAETAVRRGETRSIVVYQMLAPEGSSVVQVIDKRTQQTISLSPPTRQECEGKHKRSPSKNGGAKPVQKRSPSKSGTPSEGSPSTFGSKPLHFYRQGGPKVEGNKADVNGLSKSSSNAREAVPVDNSAAAAACDSKIDTNPERELADLLVALEAGRGKRLLMDSSRDRVHVLTWVGKGVTADQLREAHRRAVARRIDDGDVRPTYAAFVAPFVTEVLTPAATPPAASSAPAGDWFRSPEGVDAKSAELGHRERKADEDWRYFRVLVARAARDARAIEHVLSDAQRFNAHDLYQFARATFGDALMPVDDYAS